MFTTRELLIFLAGAEVFHVLTHIALRFSGKLPIKFFFTTWDQRLNLVGIIINTIIAADLLWWAHSLR